MRNLLLSILAVFVMGGTLVSCQTSQATQDRIAVLREAKAELQTTNDQLSEDLMGLEITIATLEESGDASESDIALLRAQLETSRATLSATQRQIEILDTREDQLVRDDHTNQVTNWTALLGTVLSTTGLGGLLLKRHLDKQPSRGASDLALVQDKLTLAEKKLGDTMDWINRYGNALHEGLNRAQSPGSYPGPGDTVPPPPES